MDEINWPEMELVEFVVIAAVIALTVQLILCFKGRKWWIRTLPAGLCIIAAAVCLVMTYFTDGWDAIGFAFLAIFLASLLIVCGAGWGIWAVVRRLQSRR